jgi:hypothetical protein
MRTTSRFLTALLVLAPLLVAGCGKAAAPSIEPEVVFSTAVPKDLVKVIPKDQIRKEAKPVVGVTVDGRVYPKGKQPAAAKAEAPAAPEAGKGNLSVSVALANRLSFTHMLRVVVLNADESAIAFYQDFYQEALTGQKITANATNLAPGDYHLKLESYNEAGQLFDTDTADATVTADKTASAAL